MRIPGLPRQRRTVRLGVGLIALAAVNAPLLAPGLSAAYTSHQEHRPAVEASRGVWDITGDTGSRTVHAVVLHTGKVLLMAGSGNSQSAFDAKSFTTTLWDPATNTTRTVRTPWDVFCAGHSFLSNGDVLIAGGTKKYELLPGQQDPSRGTTVDKKQEFEGLKDSYVFHVATSTYVKVGDLNSARWYPTLLTLPGDKVLAVSGLDAKGKINAGTTEEYDPTTRRWVLTPALNRYFPTYPGLTLMADGRIFYSGANAGYGSATVGRQPGLWDLTDNTFQAVPGLPDAGDNETSTSVLLAPAQKQEVMIVGGGGVGDSRRATARTAVADLAAPEPHYVPGPALAAAKRYVGAVTLPDDTLLLTGGSTGYRKDDSRTAQLYDPATGRMTSVAAPHVGRDYHSESILLPDGRVATFGSNPLDATNSFEQRIEIYSPAYLFHGPRPVLSAVPTQVPLGSTVLLRSSRHLSRLRLIRPAAVTHDTDTEQRSVAVPLLAQAGGTVAARVPANPDLLPPDWYMLFGVDDRGVPSVASWVQIGPAGAVVGTRPVTVDTSSTTATDMAGGMAMSTPAPGAAAAATPAAGATPPAGPAGTSTSIPGAAGTSTSTSIPGAAATPTADPTAAGAATGSSTPSPLLPPATPILH